MLLLKRLINAFTYLLIYLFTYLLLTQHYNEQRDTAKDVSMFRVQHSGIHSHCLFVIHH